MVSNIFHRHTRVFPRRWNLPRCVSRHARAARAHAICERVQIIAALQAEYDSALAKLAGDFHDETCECSKTIGADAHFGEGIM